MRRRTRTLAAAVLTAIVVGGTAGWAFTGTQTPVTGPPPGTASWRADTSLGRPLPDPVTSTPRQTAAFFADLTDEQRQQLVRRHASVVGNLDGAPPALRYEANALAIRAGHDPRYRHLAGAGRQILAFDPRGRGQVAEVFGNLTKTQHVSVVVPGSDIDASTFDRTKDRDGALAGMARSLRAATGNRTAVVAWAGYTTPVGLGLDAATGRLADAGADRLTRFTRGLEAAGVAEPALFCHSYGSVVCGLAAHEVRVSDIVVFGSPGMRAHNEAQLHTRARVWAAKDPSDWISKVPNVELAGLGHGADPTDPDFGARRVDASDAHGHTGYLAPGTASLRAFAAIAEGDVR
ncbi:hypothetical protein HY68_18075 [Streptomyces sp. AcH 505]|uniref:alpha/beta hydrolase n=1 Tax=Streptomyces sp. AcH 505 TaxID=352211 RepID=UPI00059243AE|nr:hypothetical protein HY68_18075 [Streptomyces sp. AcH 505]